MVEAGITSVTTHVCIDCSIDRRSTFWTSLDKASDREQQVKYGKDSFDSFVPEWAGCMND